MTGLKLEVGRYYRTRDGRKVGPMKALEAFKNMLWSNVDGSYHGDGRHFSKPQNDLIAEWTDTPEVGTLKEIGAQPGDTVECVDSTGAYGSLRLGCEYEIAQSGLVIDAQGEEYDWIAPRFRIISCAQTGPVRTVTRQEIVPGRYNGIDVGAENDDGIHIDLQWVRYSADELTDAIATLTAIRDAMQANDTA